VKTEDKKYIKKVLTVLEDGKAIDPLVMDLRKLTTMTDYFVIAHGANTRQVQALARALEEDLAAAFSLKPHHIEGFGGGQWILLDYGFFIVHIFLEDRRGYYSLERIWMDAPRVEL
jgi:ribosome-associated protein